MEPTGLIEGLQESIDAVPGALLAIALLVGPTVIWLFYRFVLQPRTSRYAGDGPEPLWVCADCRSANQIRAARCYACGLERAFVDGEIEVVDGDRVVALGPTDQGTTEPVSTRIPVAVMAQDVKPAATAPRRLVAVGPGGAPEEAPTDAPAEARTGVQDTSDEVDTVTA
jgi:hypothetical protein